MPLPTPTLVAPMALRAILLLKYSMLVKSPSDPLSTIRYVLLGQLHLLLISTASIGNGDINVHVLAFRVTLNASHAQSHMCIVMCV